MRVLTSWRNAERFLLSLFFAASLHAQAANPEPIDGKWLGRVGDEQTGSVIGFEFKRRGAELTAKVHLEVMHYYDTELPPVPAPQNGQYRIDAFAMTLSLDGDRLIGEAGYATKQPVELRRVATLPTDPLPDDTLPRGPGPRWQIPLGAPVYATAATRDGVAYLGTTGGVFNAIKIVDGSFAWTFAAGGPIYGEALATNDAVYFVCDNGYLFKLDRATGKELWRYDLGDAQVPRVLPHVQVYDYDHESPKPVLADGTVFVGSGDGSFHAVNDASGARVWRIESKGKIRTTAAITGDNIVFTTLAGVVCVIERASGKEVWKTEGKTPVTSSPVVAGDKLLIGSRGSILRALQLSDGAELWRRYWWGSWIESTPVLADGRAYIGSSDYRWITCFNPDTGHVEWKTDVFGWTWGKVIVTSDTVYAAAAGAAPYSIRHLASVVALDRASGKIKWRWPHANPHGAFTWGFAAGLAQDGDTLVVGSLEGVFYAFPLN